jgi:hypothetical protein
MLAGRQRELGTRLVSVTPRTSPIQHEPASAETEQPSVGQAAADHDVKHAGRYQPHHAQTS